MAKSVVWDRTNQQVIESGGRAVVFASAADADVWINRQAQVKKGDKQLVQFDKLSVL